MRKVVLGMLLASAVLLLSCSANPATEQLDVGPTDDGFQPADLCLGSACSKADGEDGPTDNALQPEDICVESGCSNPEGEAGDPCSPDQPCKEGLACQDTVCAAPTIADATSDIDEATPRRVVRTRFASDTWRDIEYDVDTGDLWFIGEKSHGLDYFTDEGNDLWWCYMNTSDPGSGLLEFLMTHDLAAPERQAQALEEGWATYEGEDFSFLTFEPLTSQQIFVNSEAPDTPGDTHTTEAYTDDYVEVNNEDLFVVLYRNAGNGHVYLGLGGADLSAANLGTLPPGDGSPNRDNGVRTDVAYKTTVALSEEARQALLEQFELVEPLYDDSASAYDYQHPPGL